MFSYNTNYIYVVAKPNTHGLNEWRTGIALKTNSLCVSKEQMMLIDDMLGQNIKDHLQTEGENANIIFGTTAVSIVTENQHKTKSLKDDVDELF